MNIPHRSLAQTPQSVHAIELQRSKVQYGAANNTDRRIGHVTVFLESLCLEQRFRARFVVIFRQRGNGAFRRSRTKTVQAKQSSIQGGTKRGPTSFSSVGAQNGAGGAHF